MVSFTGSTRAGKRIGELASQTTFSTIAGIDNMTSSVMLGNLGSYHTNYTENAAAVPIVDSDIRITDADSSLLQSATVKILNPQKGDLLVLNASLPTGITCSGYDAASGQIRLVGAATASDYQTALRALGFANTTDDPAAGTRQIQVTVNDGQMDSAVTLALVGVTPVNDAPVAVADVATAVEAGGVNNGTPGRNPSGNVLSNDRDLDAGDSLSIASVSSGAQTALVGQTLQGAYGTLLMNADGSYRYVVDQRNPAVEGLRTPTDTLTETFTYVVVDQAGARSTATLTVTVHGQDDSPAGIGFGPSFDGSLASCMSLGAAPAAMRDFTLAFAATPLGEIVLHLNEGGHVDPLHSGQRFAIAPQRQSAWPDANHASVGVSVGTNGVSVYADNGALTPLLTWQGEVTAQTRIGVIVQDLTLLQYLAASSFLLMPILYS